MTVVKCQEWPSWCWWLVFYVKETSVNGLRLMVNYAGLLLLVMLLSVHNSQIPFSGPSTSIYQPPASNCSFNIVNQTMIKAPLNIIIYNQHETLIHHHQLTIISPHYPSSNHHSPLLNRFISLPLTETAAACCAPDLARRAARGRCTDIILVAVIVVLINGWQQ